MAITPLGYAKGSVLSLDSSNPLTQPVAATYGTDIRERVANLPPLVSKSDSVIPELLCPELTGETFVDEARVVGGRSVVVSHNDRKLKLKGATYALIARGLPNPDLRIILPPLAMEYLEPRKIPSPYWFIYRHPSGKGTYWKFDHPRGVLFDTMVRESILYNYLHFLNLSPGEKALGIAQYDLKYKGKPMGHGITELTGPEWRTVDIVFNHWNYDEDPALAKATLERIATLQESLGNPPLFDLLAEKIFHACGEKLFQLHTNGIIYGPRQGNFPDFSVPDNQGVHPCDFENALLSTELTPQQFYEYACDDLISHLQSTDVFVQGISIAFSLLDEGKVDGPCPRGLEEMWNAKLSPQKEILRGYFQKPITGKMRMQKELLENLQRIHEFDSIQKEQQKTLEAFYSENSSFPAIPDNVLRDPFSSRFPKRIRPPQIA